MNTFKLSNQINRPNRFEATVAPSVPFRGVTENRLERLKEQLLAAELQQTPRKGAESLLRRAAEEAAALVWLTPYPLLLLPTLLEEKVAGVHTKAERQARIRHHSDELLMLAE